MTRGPLSFKETDLVRAIRCAVKAGLQVAGYEVNTKTGSILVHVGDSTTAAQPKTDDWDKALAREDRSQPKTDDWDKALAREDR